MARAHWFALDLASDGRAAQLADDLARDRDDDDDAQQMAATLWRRWFRNPSPDRRARTVAYILATSTFLDAPAVLLPRADERSNA